MYLRLYYLSNGSKMIVLVQKAKLQDILYLIVFIGDWYNKAVVGVLPKRSKSKLNKTAKLTEYVSLLCFLSDWSKC